MAFKATVTFEVDIDAACIRGDAGPVAGSNVGTVAIGGATIGIAASDGVAICVACYGRVADCIADISGDVNFNRH